MSYTESDIYARNISDQIKSMGGEVLKPSTCFADFLMWPCR